jgi:glycosyltransferase involved in cell wall biosynthesis
MRGLKICFSVADQSFQRAKSIGILNVSLGLLESLAAHPAVEKLAILSTPSLTLPLYGGDKVVTTNFDAPTQGKMARLIWDQWGVYRAAAKSDCNWLFLPKGYASFVTAPPIKLAAYVHDAMQDFYRRRYPGTVSRAEEWYFDHCVAATMRRASVIFTNSDFSREEVLRMAAKLNLRAPLVITAGIGFSKPPSSVPAKENYIVMLVSKWPHKLTRLALEYLQRWQKKSAYSGAIHLVGQLPENMARVDLPNWKHFQRLPDAEYVPMLRHAQALVYFSEYEGFGMPPIEAILQGTPPVYSRIPAMEETSLGCGFLFDNNSEEDFQSAIDEALQCDARTIETWADRLLATHHWPSVAERVVAGLKQAASDD